MKKTKGDRINSVRTSLLVLITASVTWAVSSLIHVQPSIYGTNKTLVEPSSVATPAPELNLKIPPNFFLELASKREPKSVATLPPGLNFKLPASLQHELTSKWMRWSELDIPSRVFPRFTHDFPCVQGEPALQLTTPAHDGILFQRPHKTGSTTMVGIVLRLAHNRAKGKPFLRCKSRANHGTSREYEYFKRDPTRSFLFTIIRDPTKRFISEFFHFRVTAYQVEPTDANFKSVARQGNYDYYLREMTTREYVAPEQLKLERLKFAMSKGFHNMSHLLSAISSKAPGTELLNRQLKSAEIFGANPNITQVISDILHDFNFIALMERLDESLVVLQILLNLTTKEILYTRARSSGSFSNGWHGRPCFYIVPSFLTKGMKTFFASKEWQETVKHDLMFFQAANKSLDRTIEALGREEFEAKLAQLKRGIDMANENCKDRVRGMCSEGGEPIPVKNRTCYIWAEGCDHDCIDELTID